MASTQRDRRVRPTLIWAAALLVGLIAGLHAAAHDAPPLAAATAPRWTLVDQAGGVMRAVAWDGRWLYLGVGPRLHVAGRCGRPDLAVVGRTAPMGGIVQDVVVDGDRAWVALGPAGVAAVDVRNPADPRAGAVLALPGAVAELPGEALALALDGDRLWVAGSAGVHLLDVSTGSPRLAGHRIAPEGGFGGAALDVALDAGGRAYVAWSMHGLRVMALEGDHIRELGRDPRGTWFAEALDVADGIAWVAGEGGILRAIDVSDPAEPVERSAVPFTEPEEPLADLAVLVAGASVYVTGAGVGQGGVHVQQLDADPAAPHRRCELAVDAGAVVAPEDWLAGNGTMLAFAHGRVLIAADRYGLAPLVAAQSGGDLRASRTAAAKGDAGRGAPVTLAGSRASLAARPSQPTADLAASGIPETWLMPFPPAEAIAGPSDLEDDGFAAAWAWAAAGTGGALRVDSGSSLPAPRPDRLGSSWSMVGARDVAGMAGGEHALVAADALHWVGMDGAGGTSRAALLDVLTEPGGRLERVAADGDLAVVAGPGVLVFAELPEGSAPIVRATVPIVDPELDFDILARDVAVDGAARRAVLVDGSWFYVVDLTDPAAPRLASVLDVPGSTIGVALAGDTAWVATEFGGLIAVDLTDPAAPSIVQTVPGLEGARAVAIAADGERAFVALGAAGVAIVRLGDVPVIEATVDTPGTAVDVGATRIVDRVDGIARDGVWVADREGGLALVADVEGVAEPLPTPVPLPTSCPLPEGAVALPYSAQGVGMP